MSSTRLAALRELASEADLERRDFLYEATEQLRRFIDSQRERLAEIGPIVLVDDEQDHLVYHPVDGTWTTRLTYQDPADGEWYDEEQVVESISEVVELYNPADIYAWLTEAARDPAAHLLRADELEREEAPLDEEPELGPEDWQRELPPEQRERLAAQRLWQLADAYRAQVQSQQKQLLREFISNAEEVLAVTGDLVLVEDDEETLILRSDGRFETTLDLSELPHGGGPSLEPHRGGLAVTDARTIPDFYDLADLLAWVTDALAERYPSVDFKAVYE